MRIGEVAAQAGVNVQTVRLYERLGLLGKPPRLASGYRDYAQDTVHLIQFIKRSQRLGFSLGEIKTLIVLRRQGGDAAADTREMAAAKIAEIERKIAHLQEMRDAIEHGMKVCQCATPYPLCLLVEAGAQTDDQERDT